MARQVPYLGISAQYESVHLNCAYIEWGAFEVRELELDDEGQVKRAWIVFEDRCGIKPQGAYGEIRIGMPPPATVPSIVRWPAYDSGHGGTPSRVTVAAGATAARIVGEDAEEFAIAEDGCRGVAPGPCDLLVSYRTLAPGTKRAWLELDHLGGGRTHVALQGFAYGGETSLTLVSDPGDWIGEGRTYRYGPEYFYWFNSYKPSYLRGDLARTWGFKFEDPTGAPIVAKTYADAVESGGGSGPIMEVSGGPSLHACASVSGSFTVHEITHGPYEEIRTLALSFVQHCDRGIPALRGTLKHRAGDETPLAPWLVDAPSVTPLGAPPGGGPNPTPTPTPSPSPDPTSHPRPPRRGHRPQPSRDVTRPRVTVLRSVATGATVRVSEPVRLTTTLRSCRRTCHSTQRTFTLAAGRHTLSARRLAGRSRFTRGSHTLRLRGPGRRRQRRTARGALLGPA